VNHLQRHLGIPGAMAIGLASMVGAGVFFVWAPAAAVAGSGLLIGLLIAAVVATLNALSSAQLAMAHPVSGGAYAYGRALLGPWWGFAAGWLFLAGKTASAGAIALIAGGYLWPGNERLVAVLVILVLGTVNALGVRSTASVSGAVVAVVLAGLAGLLVLVALWLTAGGQPGGVGSGELLGTADAGWLGILQSAGLLFFCFAGYARMATLGEEARNPRHTLPRAILAALAVALVLYAAVGTACVLVLGPDRLARSASPLAELAEVVTGSAGGWVLVVSLVAALACLGSLLGILAGLSRTGLAMARDSELPGALSRVSERTSSPVIAEASVAALAIAAVLLLDPARLVGFSATCVLVYYAIAHLAALRQPRGERWLHPAMPIAGAFGCALLAFTLPWQGVLIAALVLGVGLAARGIRVARGSTRA
jgi:APA family basic amino acid/polyamine antiporter